MTNKDDIVIPRAELPRVLVSFAAGETYFSLENSPYSRWAIGDNTARQTRKQAMDNLALADAIDCFLAEGKKKAEEAKVMEEKKLDEESLVLHNALHDNNSESWGEDSYAKKYWRNVARAARELHGK